MPIIGNGHWQSSSCACTACDANLVEARVQGVTVKLLCSIDLAELVVL